MTLMGSPLPVLLPVLPVLPLSAEEDDGERVSGVVVAVVFVFVLLLPVVVTALFLTTPIITLSIFDATPRPQPRACVEVVCKLSMSSF